MSDLSQRDPLRRFLGLADLYSRCRPTYPDAAIECIISRCELKDGPTVFVDVGCGTGISSRLFAERGFYVIGIDPNPEMLQKATAETARLSPQCTPEFRAGQAEATGLSNSVADIVLSAQAFHWFKAEAALREFHRILKPNGWVALLWNERDKSDPFTAAYGAVVQSTPEAKAIEFPRGRAGEPLLASPLFENAERLVFANEQRLDEEGLLGRAFSASYAPKRLPEIEAFASALRDVFARFQQDGHVIIHYKTSLYLGRRAECPR
jgi:SAM-dependent methyltransferase